MGFVKCPRCDLNYMQDTEKYCAVCSREMKGDAKDGALEMCSVCGENPALPGKDMCLFCLKEMGKSNDEGTTTPSSDDDDAVVTDDSALELDSTSNMDEIDLEIDSDIPQNEFGEITRELSLSKALEDEEALAREDENEDDL